MIIQNVTLYSNGNVMVFDEKGQQIPEFQERADRSASMIIEASSEETDFYFGVWRRGLLPITQEVFGVLALAPWDQMKCWQD